MSKTSSLGMDKELLHVLKKKNIKIITSSDAHCPEDVGDKIRELEICVANAKEKQMFSLSGIIDMVLAPCNKGE